MKANERVREFVEALIQEGETVKASKWYKKGNWVSGPPAYVDLQAFKKWRASCHLLLSMLGSFGDTWRHVLEGERDNGYGQALTTLGTLEAIRENLEAGRLVRFEHLAAAEVFADLQSQAEYLLGQGYHLAAGVLFRAVLEEKLRRMARDASVEPNKDRPTIADFNDALYKAKVYDKVTLKHVESMAAVGNDAAHAKESVGSSDIQRLGRDVASFLAKFGA